MNHYICQLICMPVCMLLSLRIGILTALHDVMQNHQSNARCSATQSVAFKEVARSIFIAIAATQLFNDSLCIYSGQPPLGLVSVLSMQSVF